MSQTNAVQIPGLLAKSEQKKSVEKFSILIITQVVFILKSYNFPMCVSNTVTYTCDVDTVARHARNLFNTIPRLQLFNELMLMQTYQKQTSTGHFIDERKT